jgi:hypothetical protein
VLHAAPISSLLDLITHIIAGEVPQYPVFFGHHYSQRNATGVSRFHCYMENYIAKDNRRYYLYSEITPNCTETPTVYIRRFHSVILKTGLVKRISVELAKISRETNPQAIYSSHGRHTRSESVTTHSELCTGSGIIIINTPFSKVTRTF